MYFPACCIFKPPLWSNLIYFLRQKFAFEGSKTEQACALTLLSSIDDKHSLLTQCNQISFYVSLGIYRSFPTSLTGFHRCAMALSAVAKWEKYMRNEPSMRVPQQRTYKAQVSGFEITTFQVCDAVPCKYDDAASAPRQRKDPL